jgi:hypothetical protein
MPYHINAGCIDALKNKNIASTGNIARACLCKFLHARVDSLIVRLCARNDFYGF